MILNKMTTLAPKSEKIFVLAPAGTHMARCYYFLHIGTNLDQYMGEPKEFNKIRLTFELPEETKVFKEERGPEPIVISQEYTLSLGEKANLRKLVEGILGKTLTENEADTFDLESLVGEPCLLTIKHKTSKAGNERAEIASAAPLMKGQKCPKQVNASKILTYTNWSQELFETLPNFLKEKMKTSREHREMITGEKVDVASDTVNPEDIPF